MKKLTLLIILVVSITSFFNNPIKSQSLVNWISIEEAEKLQEETPKTILIDMYTDWCGWCKRMDQNTFNNPAIANYINNNFYPVKFNAESKDSVVYRGETYHNNSQGQRPTHDLAKALMGGRMSYPTIVYVDNNFRTYPVPGYMDPVKIEPLLVYFAERINHNCDFADFDKDYKNTFDPEFEEDIEGEINWLNITDAFAKMETEPKKFLIFLNSDYVTGSQLMTNSVFKHPVISKYMNDNFYNVKINYDTQDTIKLLNNTFVNQDDRMGHPHQLAIALLQPEIRMPAIIFFDSEFRLIFALRGYFPPKVIERYMSFITNDLYNVESWEDFNANFESEIE